MKFLKAIKKLQKVNTNNIVVETVPKDQAKAPVAIETPSAKEDEKQTRYSHVYYFSRSSGGTLCRLQQIEWFKAFV